MAIYRFGQRLRRRGFILQHRMMAFIIVISLMAVGSMTAMNAFAEAPIFSKTAFSRKHTASKRANTNKSGRGATITKKSNGSIKPVAVAASAVVPVVQTPVVTVPSKAANWEQDFTKQTGNVPDASVWGYETNPDVPGWNDEKQAYTSSTNNVRIESGVGLVIEARKEAYTYPGTTKQFAYTSGRIDTRKSFSFEFGKIEATMKLPKGAGTWPAFWMLSANQVNTSKLNPTDADWQKPRFYAKDGEVDIMEHYGNLPGLIEGTLHSYITHHEGSTKIVDYSSAFHTYGVEIKSDAVIWSVDGKPFYTLNKVADNTDAWPVGGGNKFYPILNLAMGGSGGGTIDDSAAPWRMEVQRVRYFAP